jgi:hypothetical protein
MHDSIDRWENEGGVAASEANDRGLADACRRLTTRDATAAGERGTAHARAGQRSGASEAEIMEAIWVAAVMRSGGADAHSLVALEAAHQHDDARAR